MRNEKGALVRGLVLCAAYLAVVQIASAEPQPPKRIHGISPAAAARLPGIAALFDLRNASETPRILEGEKFVPGDVVARFSLELDDFEVEEIARQVGAHSLERKSPLGLFVLHGPPSRQGMETLMRRLWQTGAAVSIDANYLGKFPLSYVPNDPHHVNGNQWYHEAPSDIDLDVTSAWEITRGSTDVVVAVIDSGLILDHPELVGRLFVNPGEIPGNQIDDDSNGYVDDVSGWNVFNFGNGDPTDPPLNQGGLGHGTWVSSIIMANTNNAHQVAGFDHFVKILPIRAFDNTQFQYGEVAAAFDYVVANPDFAQVVNMSFGGLSPLNPPTTAGLTAMANTALLITGSGNSYQAGPGNADLFNPAAHPGVITVAGTDSNDAHAVFSDTGNSVQFAAPAVGIYTAPFPDPSNPTQSNPSNPVGFHVGDGTSFAAPMVTGITTLALAIRPELTKAELVFALRQSAVDLGAPGRDPEFGWGRVNAHGALQVVASMLFWDGFETGDTTKWDLVLP